MRLVVLLLFITLARADVFAATPGVLMASPLPASVKLRADSVSLTFNASSSDFTLSLSAFYQVNTGPTGFVTASVSGQLALSAPSLMEFALDNSTNSCSEPTNNKVRLCPFLAEQLSGPWAFGAVPSAGSTTELVILASTQRTNFLGMMRPIGMLCTTLPCVDMNALVPPAPVPSNSSFTVRADHFCRAGRSTRS
jgi:hypothetical protein